MATSIGPLLLVLLGAGGLVILFGRRLPAIRSELTLSGAAARGATKVGRAADRSVRTRATQAVRLLLSGAWRFVRIVARVVGRLLQRPPVILRVPRVAFPAAFRTRFGGAKTRPALPGTPVPPQAVPRPAEEHSVPVTLLPPLPEPDEVAPTAGAAAVSEERAEEVRVLSGPSTVRPPDALGSPHEPGGTGEATVGRPLPEMWNAASAPAPPPIRSGTPPAPGRRRGARTAPSDERGTGKREAVRLGAADPRRTGRARRARVPSTVSEIVRAAGANLEEAAQVLEKGQLARAEALLVDALAQNPRDLVAYRLLGLVYLQRDDFVQAKEVLEEALRRDPAEAALYGLLGRAYFGLGEYGKALQMYQRAHDTDEKSLEYLERLLVIAARMDRRPLVKVTAEKILALEPNHAEAKKHLARVVAGG